MKVFLIIVLMTISTQANPLPIADDSSSIADENTEVTESNNGGKEQIVENLKKLRTMVLDKFQQMRSGRKIENEAQTNEPSENIKNNAPKRGRRRYSKIMKLENGEVEATTELSPGGEEKPQEEKGEVTPPHVRSLEDLKKLREQKALHMYPYYQPSYGGFPPELGYFYPPKDFSNHYNLQEEWLGRTEPFKRKNAQQYADSPIYYIRLPPSPYVYVPGVGYVSRPPSVNEPEVLNSIPNGTTEYDPKPEDNTDIGDISPNNFIHLPIDFVSNGKPTSIYQLPNDPTPKPTIKPEHFLNKGPYYFNGKPIDIHILRNSYNSIYSEALTNFYP